MCIENKYCINTVFPIKNAIKIEKSSLRSRTLCLILMKFRTVLGRGSKYNMLLNWLGYYM